MAKISDVKVYNPGPKFALGSAFAPRKDPFTGKTRFHAGQDLRADIGTAVPSATDGIVKYSGYNSGLGHLVGVESVAGRA